MVALAVLFVTCGTARADAVWQALFFEPDILCKTWWVIPVGLIIEFPAVLTVTGALPVKAAWITVLMNAASFVLGSIAQFPSLFLGGIAGTAYMFAAAILGNTLIEAAVVRAFSPRAFAPRALVFLLVVNALSVGLTLIVLLHFA